MKKRFKWDKQYLYWGITAFLVLLAATASYLLLSRWHTGLSTVGKFFRVLSPVIYGLVIAYLLTRPVKFFERAVYGRLFRRREKSGARKRTARRSNFRLFGKSASRASGGRRSKPVSARKTSDSAAGGSVFRQRRGGRGAGREADTAADKTAKRARALAVFTVIAIVLAVIISALWILLPGIYDSLTTLVANIPAYTNNANEWANAALDDNPALNKILTDTVGDISAYVNNFLTEHVVDKLGGYIMVVLAGVINVIKELLNFIIGLVVAVYVLYNREAFAANTKKLLCALLKPKAAEAAVTFARFLDRACGSFIIARLLDALIVGITAYIALILLNIPYALVIALVIGVTNIIPFFGPFIGAVPSAFLLLLVDPKKCLIFVIFIVILQQVDGNLLYPRIQGETAGLSGFWILFAVVLFGGLFGIVGFVIGVPLFSVVYNAVALAVGARLKNRGLPTDASEYAAGLPLPPGTPADAEPAAAEANDED
ncbi:MAG: AI-2E family transporter [Oscillospiraceae bacterium]|jgi:predicted PurR-regulated permease PerM|nr:AI-2E family transporter [Oscillospiraceae bacterium]